MHLCSLRSRCCGSTASVAENSRGSLATSAILTLIVFLYRWQLLGGIGGYRLAGTEKPFFYSFDLIRVVRAFLLRLPAVLTLSSGVDARARYGPRAADFGRDRGDGDSGCCSRRTAKKLWLGLAFTFADRRFPSTFSCC